MGVGDVGERGQKWEEKNRRGGRVNHGEDVV